MNSIDLLLLHLLIIKIIGLNKKSVRKVISFVRLNILHTMIIYHKKNILEQKKVISECLRVLKPSGSLFYNHIDIMTNHLTIHPSWVYDFPLKQVIVWDKCGTPKIDKSYFLPFTEWIFWIKKDKDSVPYFDRNSALFKKNIWSIPRSQESNHPAPFAEKMVENIILSCSKLGDLVYDPFMGSGTTYRVGRKYNRNVIGSEISEEYTKLSEDKITKHDFF